MLEEAARATVDIGDLFLRSLRTARDRLALLRRLFTEPILTARASMFLRKSTNYWCK